jgi:cyclophilin family peptidyl-prolyl cis-trans isomerase
MVMRRRFLLGLGAYCGLALLFGLGTACGDGAASGGGGSSRENSSSSKGGGHADLFREAPLPAGASPKPIVRLKTSAGEILLELDRRAAPDTVENFLGYVKSGFYAGVVFHRVVPGVLVHGGAKDERGAEKRRGPAVRFEGENGKSHRRGTVAMWRAPEDPESATSEFFFNLADNNGRGGVGAENFDFQSRNRGPAAFGYCVFGKAKDAASLEAMDLLAKASETPKILAAEIVSE